MDVMQFMGQRLCEDVSSIDTRVKPDRRESVIAGVKPNEVIFDVYMLCTRVMGRIGTEGDGTFIVNADWCGGRVRDDHFR
jgi:hypothetical protein